MELKIFVLLCMLFFHIVDDYYLQGWLASAKQKSWWEQNAPDKLYKNDYLMALLMHSFSWSFMVMIPIMAFMFLNGTGFKGNYAIPYFVNMAIHAIVDDMKANKKVINLIQDQSTHIVQIVVTWMFFFLL